MTFIKYAKVKIGKSNHLNDLNKACQGQKIGKSNHLNDLHKVCQGQKIGKSNHLNDLHKVCHSQKIGKSNHLKGFVGKKIKGSKQDRQNLLRFPMSGPNLFFIYWFRPLQSKGSDSEAFVKLTRDHAMVVISNFHSSYKTEQKH